MIFNGLLDDLWDGFLVFMADICFLLVLFSILSLYLSFRGQGRAQRGRRPLHKIRVCLSLGTIFYKQTIPK